MGNYGNTVDRWYRRAAVVMWPKERSFAARAEAGSAWALRTLRRRIDADLEAARADAMSLEPFWLHIEAHAFAPALRVAEGLHDPVAARVVLAPFRLEMLTANHAELLSSVDSVYGDTWLHELIDTWDSDRRFTGMERSIWVGDTLLPLCRRCARAKRPCSPTTWPTAPGDGCRAESTPASASTTSIDDARTSQTSACPWRGCSSQSLTRGARASRRRCEPRTTTSSSCWFQPSGHTDRRRRTRWTPSPRIVVPGWPGSSTVQHEPATTGRSHGPVAAARNAAGWRRS